MAVSKIIELILTERDAESDAAFRPAGKIRHALLKGERLTRPVVIERWGVTGSLLDMVIRDFRALGYKVECGPVAGHDPNERHPTSEWWVTNPRHIPTEEQAAEMRRRHQPKKTDGDGNGASGSAAKGTVIQQLHDAEQRERDRLRKQAERDTQRSGSESTPARRPGRPRNPMPLPVLPAISQQLRVFMLAVDDENGIARIGLRNGDMAWVCTVEAQEVIDGALLK